MIKTFVTSVDSGSGHACGLVDGLRSYRDVEAVWMNENKHGLDYLTPDAKIGYDYLPPEGDELVVVGIVSIEYMNRYLKKKQGVGYRKYFSRFNRVVVIVTDDLIMLDPAKYNEMIKGIEVLAAICKIDFVCGDARVYYRPFDLSHIQEEKADKITVSHSPFSKKKQREKGSQYIFKVVNRIARRGISFNFDLITEMSWDEALRRKARSHVFIDQVNSFKDTLYQFGDAYSWPALGKSGTEAMHLGCCTITRGAPRPDDPSRPPVVWCNMNNFEGVLIDYIKNKEKTRMVAEQQREWALKYATPDAAARNVLGL